jgi:dipeptidase E
LPAGSIIDIGASMSRPKNSAQRILLLSESRPPDSDFFDHAETEIRSLFSAVKSILFVPYAMNDHAAYTDRMRVRFAKMGYAVDSVHSVPNPQEAVMRAEALFVGGGNTFRLLAGLYQHQLLGAIRDRVQSGVPYLGASAGTVVAGPTLKTTNDMPILKPPSFKALRLIPFHINPHYVDTEPGALYKLGAREHRLGEFVLENKEPVVALRDGAMLSFRGGSIMLKGTASALVFRYGARPTVIASGMSLESSLLKSSKRATGDNAMAACEPTIRLTDEQQAQFMNATGKSIAGLNIDFLADLLACRESLPSGPAFPG